MTAELRIDSMEELHWPRAAPDLKFSVKRDPKLHLAFGVGKHFCFGANLARLQLGVIFRALLKHVEYVEFTGLLERLRSSFVGGIRRMSMRMKLGPHPM